MYLYLGQDTVIKTGDIVGIFDLDLTSVSGHTKEFLKKAQKSGHIREVSPEIPRSFVICGDKKDTIVYLSQLSPATLNGRNNRLHGERNDNKHGYY